MKKLFIYTRPNKTTSLMKGENKKEVLNYYKQFNPDIKLSDIKESKTNF